MAAIAKTKVSVGLLGFGVELHKATQDEGRVEMDSLCECAAKPKMAVNCGGCGKSYPSFFALPKRGYPKDADAYTVVLTQEEIAAARSGAKKHEILNIEKVTDLVALAKVYGFGGSYYVVPDRKAKEFELKAYALFVQALASTNRVMLTRHTSRGTTTRYAIVADKEKGVLLAMKVVDLREVPFEVSPVKVAEVEQAQVRMFLDAQYNEAPDFPAEEDGLVLELEKRLAASSAVGTEPLAVAVA